MWCVCRGIKTLPEFTHNLFAKRYVWNLAQPHTCYSSPAVAGSTSEVRFQYGCETCCLLQTKVWTLNPILSLRKSHMSHGARSGEHGGWWMVGGLKLVVNNNFCTGWSCNKAHWMVPHPIASPFSAFYTERKSSNSSQPRYEKRNSLCALRHKLVVRYTQTIDNKTGNVRIK